MKITLEKIRLASKLLEKMIEEEDREDKWAIILDKEEIIALQKVLKWFLYRRTCVMNKKEYKLIEGMIGEIA